MSALDIFMLGLSRSVRGSLTNREFWFKVRTLEIARAEKLNATGFDPMSAQGEVNHRLLRARYSSVIEEVEECVSIPLDARAGGMYMDIFVTDCRDRMFGDEDDDPEADDDLFAKLPEGAQDFVIACGHLSVSFMELTHARIATENLRSTFADVPGFNPNAIRMGTLSDDGTFHIL